MKKLIALMLVLILAFSFAACGKPAEEPAEDAGDSAQQEQSETAATPTIDKIKAAGKLVVGTSADFAPYEFHILDENGEDKIVGFDMDLAQAIADHIGVELEIKDMNFDSILIELQAGTVDLGIAGFSPDPERAETFDFSDIYYFGGQSFAILESNKDKYTSYEDFTGLQVAAQTGSIQADLLAENTPNASAVLLKTVPDVVMELVSGKVQGAFLETAILENYMKTYPEIIEMCPVEYDSEGSSVAIAKGNDDLLAVVNEVIAELLESGKMDEYVAAANEISDQAIA